jgi:hypothetical protein
MEIVHRNEDEVADTRPVVCSEPTRPETSDSRVPALRRSISRRVSSLAKPTFQPKQVSDFPGEGRVLLGLSGAVTVA